MPIKFQADADLKEWIVVAVKRRQPSIDFRTASQTGLEGLSDSHVLKIAAAEGRILISHDRRTMPRHFADFIQANDSPGVFIVSQRTPVEVVAEEICLIWETTRAEEWVNIICGLPL